MLNTALLTRIASMLANTEDFAVIELGTGTTQPTKNDTGIAGVLLKQVPVEITVEGNVVRVSTEVFEFTTGIAQEIVVKASNGAMRDRQLITPHTGTASTKLQIDYLLEPLGNG